MVELMGLSPGTGRLSENIKSPFSTENPPSGSKHASPTRKRKLEMLSYMYARITCRNCEQAIFCEYCGDTY